MFTLLVSSLLFVTPLIYGYQYHHNIIQQRFRRDAPFYNFQSPRFYVPDHHYDPTNAYHAVAPQQMAMPGVPPPYSYVYSNLNGYVQRPHAEQDGDDVNYNGVYNIPNPAVLGTVPTGHNSPVYYTDCPCNKYVVVEQTRQIVCVCPQLNQLAIMKCPKQNVCIPKHACNDGEISIIEFVILGTHNAVESAYCNDITHTCCRLTYPAAPAANENEKNSIDNNISNSSIKTLSNTITRYTIHGNTVKILNSGNPVVPAVEEDNKEENKTVIYDIDPRHIRRQPVELAISPKFNVNNNMNAVQLNASNSPEKMSEDSLADDVINVINNTIISSKINSNRSSEFTLLHTMQPVEIDNHAIEENEMDLASKFNTNITTVLSSTTLSAQTTASFDDASTSELTTSTERVTGTLKETELEKIFGTPDQPIASQPSSTQNIIKIETTSGFSPSAAPTSRTQPIPAELVKNPNGRIAQLRNASRTNATIGAILRNVKNKLENVNQPIVTSRINVEHLRELFAHGNPTIVIIQDATNHGYAADFDVNDGNDKKSRQAYDLSTGNEKVEVRDTSRIVGRCSTDMKCVQKTYCTTEGEVSNVRITHKEGMQLLECMNEESGLTGVCCRIPK